MAGQPAGFDRHRFRGTGAWTKRWTGDAAAAKRSGTVGRSAAAAAAGNGALNQPTRMTKSAPLARFFVTPVAAA
jgi:hypothetical protein